MKFANWRVGELVSVVSCTVAFLLATIAAAAQSPNTSTIVVLVTDQSGAMVTDAKVTVINTQTGDLRDAPSDSDGRAPFTQLTEPTESPCRAGLRQRGARRRHAARRRDRDAEGELLVGSEGRGHVCRTTTGVRADPQSAGGATTARRSTRRRSSAARSRRCRCSAPRRQGRAPEPLRQRELLRDRRRQPRRPTCSTAPATTRLGPPDDDRDRAGGRHPEIAVLSMRSPPGSAGPPARAQHRHQVGHERRARRRPVWGGPAAGRRAFATTGFCAPSVPGCVTPATLTRQPGGRAARWTSSPAPARAVRQGQDVLLRHRRLHAPGPDDLPLRQLASFVMPADGGTTASGTTARRCSTGGRPQDPPRRPDVPPERRSLLRTERRGRRHERAERGAPVHARRGDGQRQRHMGAEPEPPQRGAHRLSQRRPGHALGGADALDRIHPRRFGAVHDRPVARVEPPQPPVSVLRHAVVVARQADAPARHQRRAAHVGRNRQRARHRVARHVHLPRDDDGAVRSAEAFGRPELPAADQLRHQQLRAVASGSPRCSCRTASA